MKPVTSQAIRRSAGPPKTTGQSQARPAGIPGAQAGQQSKQYTGGDEGPLTSPVWQVSYNRAALKAVGYGCQQMNHLGEERWMNSGRVVDLQPSGHWEMRRLRDGRRLAEGQGHVALERAIADPSLGVDVRELVGRKYHLDGNAPSSLGASTMADL